MIKRIDISEYFEKYSNIPLVDVRSPGEYHKGHIPGAKNIALFSNDERAQIGTVYKQQSREKAITLGYQFVNPKLESFITESFKIAPSKTIAIHCWRGGMRSQSFAEHLYKNGFEKVYVINKGYKAFRKHVLHFFEKPFRFIVLGGYTGSGKTEILHNLMSRGLQVLDLEGLANHKGSAFGGIGQKEQPSTEHFENQLFAKLMNMNLQNEIWIEDESSNIGKVYLPKAIFNHIREQKVYFVEIPIEERAKFLVQSYGNLNKAMLVEAITKIAKRLGPLNTKEAIEAVQSNNFYKVALLALTYYDKSYKKGLAHRLDDDVFRIPMKSVCTNENAQTILAEVLKQQ